MTLPRLALSVVGDEIGPSLAEMISFCKEHDIRRLDMRTVDRRNLLGMKIDEVNAIATTLEAASIEVPTYVSPILKWPRRKPKVGQPLPEKVDFAFDPDDCPAEDPIAYAFDVAIVLRAQRVRTFSFLRYPNFVPKHLDQAVAQMTSYGHLFDMPVELENEPVCNIGTIAELARFFAHVNDREEPPKHLRPLIDIANSWAMGAPPSEEDIAYLAPMVDALHLKDRDLTTNRSVPLGDGDIPWSDLLLKLLSKVEVPEVLATIETHCFDNGREATARSIHALRRIAKEIGVELV
ncbi:MAG: hypothetical protein KIT25_25415 [Enhydrobacter sp.]|nr:MAG: hypothetical protein KIT25_25415 [Enhydrobacter sp.]